MSILTKEEREKIKAQLDDYTAKWLDVRSDDYRDALDTIDALEEYAEYLKESHKETHLGLLGVRDELLDRIDSLEGTIKDIGRATSMQQVETILIAARAFGVIEENEE